MTPMHDPDISAQRAGLVAIWYDDRASSGMNRAEASSIFSRQIVPIMSDTALPSPAAWKEERRQAGIQADRQGSRQAQTSGKQQHASDTHCMYCERICH